MDCNPFLIYYNRLLSKFIETDHENSIESIIIHGTPVRHNGQILTQWEAILKEIR